MPLGEISRNSTANQAIAVSYRYRSEAGQRVLNAARRFEEAMAQPHEEESASKRVDLRSVRFASGAISATSRHGIEETSELVRSQPQTVEEGLLSTAMGIAGCQTITTKDSATFGSGSEHDLLHPAQSATVPVPQNGSDQELSGSRLATLESPSRPTPMAMPEPTNFDEKETRDETATSRDLVCHTPMKLETTDLAQSYFPVDPDSASPTHPGDSRSNDFNGPTQDDSSDNRYGARRKFRSVVASCSM